MAPLLLPRWTPGILRALAAVELADGPVDVELLVERLARLQVPSIVPRRRRRSVARGAYVLLDLSEDMVPFRHDLLDLLRQTRRVLGDERVTVLRFAGRPSTEIGPGPRDTWRSFSPPATRRAVILVSGFRLSDTSYAEDTEAYHLEIGALLDRLDRVECPVVALVPNVAARVPERLRRRVRVVEWDRTTTAARAAHS